MGAVEAEPVQQQRQQLVEVARQMNACGVNQGTSGNLSLRIEGGLLITPSSLPYEQMEAPDLVAISFEGEPLVAGQRRPSSEWRLHADLLRHRPDAEAVVHCHSVHATALACHGMGIPSFHYMVVAAGGADIRCADYATFGTQQLSDLALAALQDRRACLMAHHGQVSLGARCLMRSPWRLRWKPWRGCICRPVCWGNHPCSVVSKSQLWSGNSRD